MRYRTKAPTEIEAVQWTGDEFEKLDELFEFTGGRVSWTGHPGLLRLLAGNGGAQGWVPVPVNHWIVRRVDDFDDFWPVDPDYFAEKYEPVR